MPLRQSSVRWDARLTREQLLQDHLQEMFSIIYTPTEGDAIQNFSRVFRRPEGCFLNINDIDRVHHDLAQWGKPEDIDYIVVTGTYTAYLAHVSVTRHTYARSGSAAAAPAYTASQTARRSSALATKAAEAS